MRIVQRLQLLLLLLQLLLIHSYGQSEDVSIPWNSTILQNGNTFSVLLGDKMIFEPCGDSNETNLVYTNNKTVFEQCIPRSNLSEETIYNDIGNCRNPSGELILPVNTGIEEIGFVAFQVNGSFYFLSDYMSECQNGLKAIINVVETRPTSPDPTATGITFTSAGASPTSAGDSPEDDPLLSSLIIPIAVGIAVLVVVVFGACCVLVTVVAVCCCKHKMTTEDLEMQRKAMQGSPTGEKEQLHPLSNECYVDADITTSTFQPVKHVLETDGNIPDAKPKSKDVSPISPNSLPAKTDASSRPNDKTRRPELSSLPPKPSLSKPRNNQVDAATNVYTRPTRKNPPKGSNVGQSLPATGNDTKPPIGAKPERMKSPTRTAPKPPPKSTAVNGFAKKPPLLPPTHSNT